LPAQSSASHDRYHRHPWRTLGVALEQRNRIPDAGPTRAWNSGPVGRLIAVRAGTSAMGSNRVEGNWKQVKGEVREQRWLSLRCDLLSSTLRSQMR
jgi:hypothetical protein